MNKGPEKTVAHKCKCWKCDKCESTYDSPIRISAVLCTNCSKKLKAREVWMKPDLSKV
jgi:hypothetical protein